MNLFFVLFVCEMVFHFQLTYNLQDFAALTKELNQAREKILEYTDEINDMKAERSNTRVSVKSGIVVYCFHKITVLPFKALMQI